MSRLRAELYLFNSEYQHYLSEIILNIISPVPVLK